MIKQDWTKNFCEMLSILLYTPNIMPNKQASDLDFLHFSTKTNTTLPRACNKQKISPQKAILAFLA